MNETIITATSITTPMKYNVKYNDADSSDNTWVRATTNIGYPNYAGQSVDSSLYAEFLNSIKERDEKVEKYITSATSFLYKEGYITQEEYDNRESERLNDIRTYDRANGGMMIVLSFDEDEWTLSVMVDDMFKITRVFLIDSEKETQILYDN